MLTRQLSMVSRTINLLTCINLAALVETSNGQRLDEFLKSGPQTEFSGLGGSRCALTILMDTIKLQAAFKRDISACLREIN